VLGCARAPTYNSLLIHESYFDRGKGGSEASLPPCQSRFMVSGRYMLLGVVGWGLHGRLIAGCKEG